MRATAVRKAVGPWRARRIRHTDTRPVVGRDVRGVLVTVI
jgi:hypothetical protein